MKKVLKWIGIVIVVIIAGVALYGWQANESRPIEKRTPEADALAYKMMAAVNYEAWDTTRVIQWTFRGAHHFLWDRSREVVQVKWDDKKVILFTKTQKGKVFINGEEVVGSKQAEMLKQAWSYFCNDSFWLNAVTKSFDKGTTRSLVKLKDGRGALMVAYRGGGVTPGDAYAWILDDNGMPMSYKMWVSIIPVGGMEVTWEDWLVLDTGAKVAQFHHSDLFDLAITDIKGVSHWAKMKINKDPFLSLLSNK